MKKKLTWDHRRGGQGMLMINEALRHNERRRITARIFSPHMYRNLKVLVDKTRRTSWRDNARTIRNELMSAESRSCCNDADVKKKSSR